MAIAMSATEPLVLAFVSRDGLAEALEKHLPGNGYAVQITGSCSQTLDALRHHTPSLVVVDRMEPSLGTIVPVVKHQGIPLLLLQPPGTPCKEEECAEELQDKADVVICTNSYREIVARIRAVLRRQQFSSRPAMRYQAGPILMDLDRHEVSVSGRLVDLTPKEFLILQRLIESPQRVFTRQELLDLVWGQGYALEEHTLDVHIYSLRHKIEPNPARPVYIATVRGIGYKLQTRET